MLSTASPLSLKIIEENILAEDIYKNTDKYNFLGTNFVKTAKKISLSKAEKIIEYCNHENISIVTYKDNKYPVKLLNISNPPLVLYCKGELPNFNSLPSLCMVGPRKVSDYGYKCAYSLAARFAIAGFIVVSGGAVGSDYAAHDGALCHGGKTVAVLGNGFGDNYLKRNEPLRERIAENGCLITEFPPKTKASKFTFPQRNRIMAGICDGTVLVEAPLKSGSLITAGFATEFNRDLFVIPGNPGNENYVGSNLLLRDGAKPLLEINDVFEEYLWKYPDKIDIEKSSTAKLLKPVIYDGSYKPVNKKKENNGKKSEKVINKPINVKIIKKILPEHLSKNAKMVYNCLDKHEFLCDDIFIAELSSAEITAALGELEIFGFITSLPGGRYSLVIKE